jgi:hypothetical protein
MNPYNWNYFEGISSFNVNRRRKLVHLRPLLREVIEFAAKTISCKNTISLCRRIQKYGSKCAARVMSFAKLQRQRYASNYAHSQTQFSTQL